MSGASYTIEIGELSLDLPARNSAHAHTLALAIAERLGEMSGLPPQTASVTIESLRIDLPPWPANGTDTEIVATVAAGIERALGDALRSRSRPKTVSEDPPPPNVRSDGTPLLADTRKFMEKRLGHDFGEVRVHSDRAASALADRMHARAVTIGDDIFVGSGQSQLDTAEGTRLLTHELTHVAQQRLGGAPAPALAREREARAAANRIASGHVPPIRQAAPVGAPQLSSLDESTGSDEDAEEADDEEALAGEGSGESAMPDPQAEFEGEEAPFPAEFDEAHPMPKLKRVPRRRIPAIRHPVRADVRLTASLPASGPGFVYSGSRGQNRTAREVIDATIAVGAQWNQLILGDKEAKQKDPKVIVRPKIQVLAVGIVYGGPLAKNRKGPHNETLFHASHDTGVDIDVLVVRRDGKEGDGKATYKDTRTYSRELTREAIDLFLSQRALQVVQVFFDDPEIALPRNLVGPDRNSTHDNHFHVRFAPLAGKVP